MSQPTRLQVFCPTCLSVQVSRDAVARWSPDKQEWELSSVLDGGDCDWCGTVKLEDMPVEDWRKMTEQPIERAWCHIFLEEVC
jgi:hypothetical protein